jgi:thymidylate synthase
VLGRPSSEANSVIVGIANPLVQTDVDAAIVAEVDRFLRAKGKLPVNTVANTIFPQSTFDRHGTPAFYEVYLEKVLPRIKRSQADWDRSFQRMISFPSERKGETINRLAGMVEKMKCQVASAPCFADVYEITIYDPLRNPGAIMNRQCLSFLSFKLTDGAPRHLSLTAVYRNHDYMQRLLGDMIGLGRLMKFVADEAAVGVGGLTIVSTRADIDTVGTNRDIAALIERCVAHEALVKSGVCGVDQAAILLG